VRDRHGLRDAATRVGEFVESRVAEFATIAQITVATLTDNALRHSDGSEAPVLSVTFAGRELEICVRDLGVEISACADRRGELVRRIQLPARTAGHAAT
jgi:hypothetical protein